MAQEKIEDVSTEKLIKRRKFFFIIAGIFVGVLLAFIGLMIYDYIKEGEIEKSTLFSGLTTLACFWIPLFIINRINIELKRRKDKIT